MAKSREPTERQREKAAEAAARRQAGKQPTRPMLRAEKACKAWDDEQAAVEWLRTMPISYYQQFTGRQLKQIRAQGETYGIPIMSAAVDLPKVIRFFHEFLSENSGRLRRKDQGDPIDEELRQIDLATKRIKLLAQAGDLIPREEMRDVLVSRVADGLASLGDRLERSCGPLAREILNEALAEIRKEIKDAPIRNPLDWKPE